jgi:hypothetical protein
VDDAEGARQRRQSALVPISPARPPQLVGRVFRGSSVVATGLLTKKQLRSSAWRRLRHDVYADSALPVTHRLLISAVGLGLPEGAGFTGRSAATLWGVDDIADPTDPVDVPRRALDGIPVRASVSVPYGRVCNWSAGGDGCAPVGWTVPST